ncbi:MAG: NUDIX domain-containing protein [Bdellovibrionales bacterium]
MKIPEFGEKQIDIKYVDRPGAYGVIEDENGRIALMRTSWGVFLPGGGINPGESELDGLAREIFEEMGARVHKASLFAKANQYLFSRHYQQYFRKMGSFYQVTLPGDPKSISKAPFRIEKDHELIWITHAQIKDSLSEGFQRWALEQWFELVKKFQP